MDPIAPRPKKASGAQDRRAVLAQERTNLIDRSAELSGDAAGDEVNRRRMVVRVQGRHNPVDERLRDRGKVHARTGGHLEDKVEPKYRRNDGDLRDLSPTSSDGVPDPGRASGVR